MGVTCYDECKSTGPIQVHTYEGRVASTDQGDSDDFKPKSSSYDQLESIHRSKPPKLPVYRCLNTERKELQDDANKNYEQCNRSGPNPVHTYEKSRDTREQGKVSGDSELKVSKYNKLEPNQRSGSLKPSEYKCLDTERKETGYIQLLDDGTEEVDIGSYERCTTSVPNPVHMYERSVNATDQEGQNDELEPKGSSYDQLEPTHRSKPLKPPEYKCLDLKGRGITRHARERPF